MQEARTPFTLPLQGRVKRAARQYQWIALQVTSFCQEAVMAPLSKNCPPSLRLDAGRLDIGAVALDAALQRVGDLLRRPADRGVPAGLEILRQLRLGERLADF